jgi:hypothetical protein
MSDLMKQFLTAYIEWIESGAQEGAPFTREYGLCVNVERFVASGGYETEKKIVRELKHMFENDGLDKKYPFGEGEYWDRAYLLTNHQHQPRIDWVRAALKAAAEDAQA